MRYAIYYIVLYYALYLPSYAYFKAYCCGNMRLFCYWYVWPAGLVEWVSFYHFLYSFSVGLDGLYERFYLLCWVMLWHVALPSFASKCIAVVISAYAFLLLIPLSVQLG